MNRGKNCVLRLFPVGQQITADCEHRSHSAELPSSPPTEARSLAAGKTENSTVMTTSTLGEIENEFARLSPEAQLTLLERLVHRARVAVTRRPDNWDAELTAMAADPEMQRELNRINAEFSATEADGLERH